MHACVRACVCERMRVMCYCTCQCVWSVSVCVCQLCADIHVMLHQHYRTVSFLHKFLVFVYIPVQ